MTPPKKKEQHQDTTNSGSDKSITDGRRIPTVPVENVNPRLLRDMLEFITNARILGTRNQ
jgi:hypothetical protein